jgi:heme A synthase
MASPQRYARFAQFVLLTNLAVILWGALVRATGAGAGCGSHWPLCNGEIVPRAPQLETLIEYGHRLTSGIALLLVIGLVIGARRIFNPRDPARRAAAWSLFFIIVEALIGAGLVLLEYVAENSSTARGFWVAGHLVNTFLLVGSLTLAAWWASGGAEPRLQPWSSAKTWLAAALGSILLLGMSGAITALGDTLFPVSSLAEGKAMTFSASAHAFIRLRIWHPTLAIAVGLVIVVASSRAVASRPTPTNRNLAAALTGTYLIQLVVGAINVWFLAPVMLQLTHLLLSDVVWILLVLLAANICDTASSPESHRSAQTSSAQTSIG